MATILHSALTGSNLHEPKGTEAASLNQVFVADGSGSGSFKTAYVQGYEDYNDSGSTQALTSGSWVDLTNNGTGAFTSTANTLPGVSFLWNTSTNSFDWTDLSIGDTVDIRLDFQATIANNNDSLSLRVDLAHGTANEYSLSVFRDTYKLAGVYNKTAMCHLYIGDTSTLNNPAKVAMHTDGAGNSVVVKGWFIKVTPKNVVYV